MTLGPNLEVFPLEQTRHVVVAKSERPRLTNGEIIFEEFRLCDHNSPTSQTDGQTDGQTTSDRNTTEVHRAVKKLCSHRATMEVLVFRWSSSALR